MSTMHNNYAASDPYNPDEFIVDNDNSLEIKPTGNNSFLSDGIEEFTGLPLHMSP